ncbi:MAG: methionyl-tRNA formyltransferase [Bacteriovoracaceae bacterium]
MKKFKCVFCGTADFSVPTLEILHHHPHIDLLKVVTMPDRPSGRGQKLHSPEVAVYAKENKIPLLQTPNINKEEEFLAEMEKDRPDFFIVISFAQFLNNRVLKVPYKGCFNIHGSLLPKYRGAAPIQYSILNGDSSTGVTIQKMVKEMDAGDIVRKDVMAIESTETYGLLYTRMKLQAALSTNLFIRQLIEDDYEAKAQVHEEATYAPTLNKDDGLLNFKEYSTEVIFNRIRGLKPWPGTFFYINNKRVKVLEAEFAYENLGPSEVSIKNNQLIIGTTDGSLRITKLQLEGKKATSDTAFLNGNKDSQLIITGQE